MADPPLAGSDRDTFEQGPFLRSLIDGMRCGVLMIDREGTVRLLNGPARRILGVPQEDSAGRSIEEVLRHHPGVLQVLRECFEMSSLPDRAEIRLGTGPEGCRTIGFTLNVVRAADGASCGAAMFFKDLTTIEYREEQERLRDRLVALGQMAANLAHEIRNPLASIEVTCKLLERRLGEDPGSRELLGKIVGEVRRLNGTLSSSLEYVRPIAPALTHGELGPVLDEAIRIAEGRGGGTRVERRYSDAVPPFRFDPELIRRAVANLVLNAVEAAGPAGTVVVETGLAEAPGAAGTPYRPSGSAEPDPWQECRDVAVIRVADDGPGMDEETLGRVFYPFFTTKKKGSGVGLAVVKKIVSCHRGVIDVESPPEGGAVFTIRLPVVSRAPEV